MQNTHRVDVAAPNCSRRTGQMLGCVPANWNTSTQRVFFSKKEKWHAALNATDRVRSTCSARRLQLLQLLQLFLGRENQPWSTLCSAEGLT